MRILLISIVFFCAIGFSCSSQCDDPAFTLRGEYYYELYTTTYKKNFPITGKLLELNLFLSELTGIKSRVNYGDVSTYSSYQDYKKDVEEWKKWFDENKCLVRIDNLQDLELKYGFETSRN